MFKNKVIDTKVIKKMIVMWFKWKSKNCERYLESN